MTAIYHTTPTGDRVKRTDYDEPHVFDDVASAAELGALDTLVGGMTGQIAELERIAGFAIDETFDESALIALPGEYELAGLPGASAFYVVTHAVIVEQPSSPFDGTLALYWAQSPVLTLSLSSPDDYVAWAGASTNDVELASLLNEGITLRPLVPVTEGVGTVRVLVRGFTVQL